LVSHWIFKVKDDENEKFNRTGLQIFQHRMPEHFWGLREYTEAGRRTPNVIHLKKGDFVLFYLVGKYCFLGTCLLKSLFRSNLTPEELKDITHPEFHDWATGVFLEEGTLDDWSKKPLPIERLRGSVHFVPRDKNFGQYLRGSVTRISEQDYYTVVREHELMH
jgi:hypothetical protein